MCYIRHPDVMLCSFVHRDCQSSGIWAWDCELKELVLVVPSVLAMLGDNPMQSEIACHIGLTAKFFCRVCRVSKGSAAADDDNGSVGGGEDEARSDAASEVSLQSQSDRGSVASTHDEHAAGQHTQKKARRKKKPETMAEMGDRVRKVRSVSNMVSHLRQPDWCIVNE